MLHELATLFTAKFLGFLRDGMLVLILFNAYLTNAPAKLPVSVWEFPQWFWTWNLEALRSFVSARMATLQASHSETMEAPGIKTTRTDTAASTVAQPAAQETK
jgi:hypothetical protein